MNIRRTIGASVIALAAMGVSAANAGVVLSDNFETSGTPGPNWLGDGTFSSIQASTAIGNPSVDLVGPGYYGNLSFAGNSIDLDGTTGSGNDPAGEIASVKSLNLGTYKVSFELAGNMRGYPEQTTTVSIGGQSQVVTLLNDNYNLYTLTFTGASGVVDFKDSGPSNQQGNLLDNVSVTAVPEPATWAMFLMGFGAIGFAMRSRKQSAALTA